MSEHESSLAEMVTRFLATLPPELRQESQQELNRFVRWYGGDRSVAELGAQEIAEYTEGLGSGAAAAKRLESVKNLLSYAKKEGLTKTNLAVHLRLGSGSGTAASCCRQGLPGERSLGSG